MSKTMNKCKDYHSRWVIKTFYSKIRERNVNYFLIYKEYNQRYLNKCHNKRNRKRFKNFFFLFCSFFKKGFSILSRLIQGVKTVSTAGISEFLKRTDWKHFFAENLSRRKDVSACRHFLLQFQKGRQDECNGYHYFWKKKTHSNLDCLLNFALLIAICLISCYSLPINPRRLLGLGLTNKNCKHLLLNSML